MDVRHDAAAGDGDGAEESGELLVVPHGELDVAGHDPRLLVVAGGVPGQLEHLEMDQSSSVVGKQGNKFTSPPMNDARRKAKQKSNRTVLEKPYECEIITNSKTQGRVC